jgi:hypothetical protein
MSPKIAKHLAICESNFLFFVPDQMKCSKKLVVLVVITMACFSVRYLHSFEHPTALKDTLKDILNCELPEKSKGDNIFFVESSGANQSVAMIPASLTSRAACAIESAAIKNPKSNIFVVIVGKSRLADSKQMRVLKSFGNIHFVHLDLVPFSRSTPMGKWIESGKLFITKFIESNTSNALRLLLLWK